MQRNQTTTANQLKQGDRFYKTTDRTKTAFELTRIESKFLNSKYWCIEAEILDRPNPPTGDRGTKQISGNTAVIFLRSKLASGGGLTGNQPEARSPQPEITLK